MAEKDFEAQRLLDNCSTSSEANYHYDEHLQKKSPLSVRSKLYLLFSHAFVAIAVFAALTMDWRSWKPVQSFSQGQTKPSLYSPFRSAIRYKTNKPSFDYWSNSRFFGEPSRDLQDAWNEILHPHALQIFPDEAERMDELNTVSLKNGNPLFIPAVMHNLHCLRRIHQTMNSDYYYAKSTEEFLAHDRHHTEHCLEAIRTSVMCSPDLTLNRFYWSDRHIHNMSVGPDVTTECVDWEAVFNVMKSRPYDESGDVDIYSGAY